MLHRLLAGGALLLGLTTTAGATDPIFPGTTWQTAAPESMGMDPAKTQVALKALFGHGALVRYGYLIGTKGDPAKSQDVYSVSKSITALTFGTLLQSGQLTYATPVPGSDLPFAPLATYAQFMAMTSDYGLDPHQPGAHYAYNNMAGQHYGESLRPFYGNASPPGVIEQALWSRIGRQDPFTFSGLWSGWSGGFRSTARDLARIGYLVLRRGKWSGQQVVPESFIDQLYVPQIPSSATENLSQGGLPVEGSPGNNWWNQYAINPELPGNYSFGWWTNANLRYPGLPAGTIWADGLYGNRIIVCPEHDLVLVNVFGDNGKDVEQVFKPFLDAIVSGPVVDVGGELRTWHDVTLTFEGPATSESDPVNPFLDYRLAVTFTQGATSVTVPGYYTADGNAAATGASAGSKWRVHFVPDQPGSWSWSASFRAGPDVAIDPNPGAGAPAAFDGLAGTLAIGPSDKQAPDFRALGLLKYADGRFPRFSATGEPFLKGGANSPENFLAYAGFDGTTPRHQFAPHAGDWQPGDPDWGAGQGKNIIGALNYLAGKGMNSVTFLTLSVFGASNDVWPWTSSTERYRYDCSKLDQWETVFDHMDQRGIHLHVLLQEAANDDLLDGGNLGIQRKLYAREMVARFSHHLAVTWNLGEENTNTAPQQKAFADHIRLLDPWDHPIAVHHAADQADATYQPLLGHPTIESGSLNLSQVVQAKAETEKWIDASNAAGRPWAVTLDEYGPPADGVLPDAADPDHRIPRQQALWASLMAGGGGVEWYFGIAWPHNDVDCEDWRSRAVMWDQTRHALTFFRQHLPFTEMQPADTLVSAPAGRCLVKPGDVYAVYLPYGGTTNLFLGADAHVYTVRWYDPRNGGAQQIGSVPFVIGPGSVSLGLPPTGPPDDWAAVVARADDWISFYGPAVPGILGVVPVVSGDDPALGNLGFHVRLWNAMPGSLGVVLIGDQPLASPFLGGMLLSNAKLGVYPALTNAIGRASFNLKLAHNPGLVGASLYFQWVVYDPYAPFKVSMTRGMRIELH